MKQYGLVWECRHEAKAKLKTILFLFLKVNIILYNN